MRMFNLPVNYHYRDDLFAGITVGVITIPQAMAFALLAGLPPIYGLYGAFLPLLVYALLGTSNFLNVGPVSVIAIFIYDAIAGIATPFSPDYVSAVVTLGLLTGVIQLVAGILRLGRYVEYLPKSVVSGFIQAAAVVIIIAQLPAAFGVELVDQPTYLDRLYYLWLERNDFNPLSTALFLGALIGLFVMARLAPKFPTAIVLLVATAMAAFIADFEVMGVALIGEVPQGLPSFELPLIDASILQLLPAAFGIAFVASLGSFVMAKNVAEQQINPWQANRDLVALGLAKIVSAFTGALIPAGSFNRSILVIKSGGKTQLTSLIAALILLLTLLVLTPIVYYLPQPVIAAIIVYSVYFLFDFPLIGQLWQTNKRQLMYLLITALTTLTIGFVEGILSGVVVSVFIEFFGKKRLSSS
ncbi:MAG: SulP family inorganic anion transporter [Flavobacteriaceae bacterium]